MDKFEVTVHYQEITAVGVKEKVRRVTLYSRNEETAVAEARHRVPDGMRRFRCTTKKIS